MNDQCIVNKQKLKLIWDSLWKLRNWHKLLTNGIRQPPYGELRHNSCVVTGAAEIVRSSTNDQRTLGNFFSTARLLHFCFDCKRRCQGTKHEQSNNDFNSHLHIPALSKQSVPIGIFKVPNFCLWCTPHYGVNWSPFHQVFKKKPQEERTIRNLRLNWSVAVNGFALYRPW